MNTQKLMDLLSKKIVPVVSIDDVKKADAICCYLLDNGYNSIEVTLRTEVANQVIRYIKDTYDILVGAGTVLSVEQAKKAIMCGADFIVSPGLNPDVVMYCNDVRVPIIPGVETATEIEKAMSLGLSFVKFFPAEIIGGIGKIKALQAPYKGMKFMPTGGITEQNSKEYLSLTSVVCCGGSYVVPKELL